MLKGWRRSWRDTFTTETCAIRKLREMESRLRRPSRSFRTKRKQSWNVQHSFLSCSRHTTQLFSRRGQKLVGYSRTLVGYLPVLSSDQNLKREKSVERDEMSMHKFTSSIALRSTAWLEVARDLVKIRRKMRLLNKALGVVQSLSKGNEPEDSFEKLGARGLELFAPTSLSLPWYFWQWERLSRSTQYCRSQILYSTYGNCEWY